MKEHFSQSPLLKTYIRKNFLQRFVKKIRKIRKIRTDSQSCDWIIQFGRASVADELSVEAKIQVENVNINVRMPKHSIDYIPLNKTKAIKVCETLLQPPDVESSRNILNVLNDDCLNEIFKKLHLLDLCSIAEVCLRFNKVACQNFASKYRKEFQFRNLINEDVKFSPRNKFLNYPTLTQMDDCLRIFGSSITSISVVFSDWYPHSTSNIVLGMINEYCKNLNEIKIHPNIVEIETFDEVIPLFSRLKKLDMQEEGTFCFEDLPNFNEQTFRFIGEHCSNMQELNLCCSEHNFDKNVLHLSQLKKMEKMCLILNFNEKPIAPAIQAFSSQNFPIESLKIGNGMVDDDAIISISQMKDISTLLLSKLIGLDGQHLIELAQNLPKLNYLAIHENFKLDGIKELLQHSNQITNLVLCRKKSRVDEFDLERIAEIVKIFKERTNSIKFNFQIICSTLNVSLNLKLFHFCIDSA